ncbi:MAG: hypothetical protein QOD41_4586 [Cryptosporangiaceae bacterium]|nr:hypothetical protein [Cryptosporangiaceae bacterium]
MVLPPGVPSMRPVYLAPELEWERSRLRIASAVVLFAAAVVTAGTFVLARWNPWSLTVLHDHQDPLAYLALVCAAAGLGAWLLLPPWHRLTGAGWIVAASATTFAPAAAGLAVLFIFTGAPHVIEQRATADGHYRLVVTESLVAVDRQWDFVVERRVNGHIREQWLGCLYSELRQYDRVLTVEPGRVRLKADDTVIDVRFDPANLRITQPIPAGLC